METRIIKSTELEFVRTMFENDPYIGSVKLTQDKINQLIEHLRTGIDNGLTLVTMSFVDGIPEVFYVGYEYPRLQGWYIGLTKIRESSAHFKTSAKVMAPTLDLLIATMQDKGYYKFWMTAEERHHNIRNRYIKKFSNYASDYEWFDELVTPKGQRSTVSSFEANRLTVNDSSSVLVRMFVLKQHKRVEFLLQKNSSDYTGTLSS